MMADYWVLPLAPLRLSVILLDKAVPQALRVTSGGKIGTTHNVGSSLRVWLVDRTRPASYKDHAWQSVSWAMLLGWQLTESTHRSMCNVLLLQDQSCQDLVF